jgi:hypothetical protein
MSNPKVYIVLLTWRRVPSLKKTFQMLSKQTYTDFYVHVSNGNLKLSASVDKYVRFYAKATGMKISVSHDGNELFAFRRFPVARKLAEKGADIIMFIDDDVEFGPNYVQDCISQYEPKSYCSGFTWNFQENGADYYKYRTKRYDNEEKIHYCGTGVSIIDAKIFLEDGLLDAPEEAHKIEDLWLSYYAQQVMNWKLKHITLPNTRIGGADTVALYKSILESPYTKAHFLRMLVEKYNWRL